MSLVYRLMAQTGYPWTVDLHVLYDLSADGLTVTQTATNLSGEPAPYASGAHPYLCVGGGPIDRPRADPARAHRLLVDDRLLPSAASPSTGRVRLPGPAAGRDTVVDHAFGDLERDEEGARRPCCGARRPRRRGAVGRRAAPVAAGLQRRRRPGHRAAGSPSSR